MKTKDIVNQAIIAAIYVILTLFMPVPQYGELQFRLSEVMTLLAFYNRKNVVGLTLGCFIANIWSPLGVWDMIFGTLGTFLATYAMSKSKNIFLAAIWPAVFSFIYGLENAILTSQIQASVIFTLQIMLAQFVIVAIIGIPLFKLLEKNTAIKNYLNGEL